MRNTNFISQGFTLIEVLVALAIISVTLVSGLQVAGSLINNAQRLETVTQAQWCADNHLTYLQLSKIYPSVGESDFGCEQLGVTYKGKQIVRPTPNPNFRRVEAKILNEQDHVILTLSTVQPRY